MITRAFIILRIAGGLEDRIMVNPAQIVKMRELYIRGAEEDSSTANCEITLTNGEKIRVRETMFDVELQATTM
jgi:hypothetical protein